MSYFDFAILLNAEIDIYIKCLVVSILLYYFLFRKQFISIFDPFTMSILGSAMGFSVVLFLKETDNINEFFFYQYIFSQIAFSCGLFFFKQKLRNIFNVDDGVVVAEYQSINTPRWFYIYSFVSVIYISVNLIIYAVAGIPLFADSRLSSFAIGGGFGIFRRMLPIFEYTSYYLTFCFVFAPTKRLYRLYSYFILMVSLIISLLSGSKSAFLTIIQILFLFCILNRTISTNILSKIVKYQVLIIMIAVSVALLTLVYQFGADFQGSLSALMFRFVSYGDTYYMAYVNNLIEELPKIDLFIALFGDFLRTIRLFPPELAPPGIGFELNDLVMNTFGSVSGPNPRHNVYGYLIGGFLGSILFSFFCGLVLSYVRRSFFLNRNRTQDVKIFLLLIYLAFVRVETDPPASIMFLNNIVLLFPSVLLLNSILKRVLR